MKSNKNNKPEGDLINPEYANLFEFSSDKKEIEHEARMIMYRFLSELERVSGPKRGLKKRLANAINKSSSFITQLFNGDKLVNLLTLAKIQKAFGIKFRITALNESEFWGNPNLMTNIFICPPNYYNYQLEESAKSSDFVQVIERSNPNLS